MVVFRPVAGPLKAVRVRMEEETVVSELKRQLEDENLDLEQKVSLLNDGLNSETITIVPVCTYLSILYNETCIISSTIFMINQSFV